MQRRLGGSGEFSGCFVGGGVRRWVGTWDSSITPPTAHTALPHRPLIATETTGPHLPGTGVRGHGPRGARELRGNRWLLRLPATAPGLATRSGVVGDGSL